MEKKERRKEVKEEMKLKVIGTFDNINTRQDGITTMRFKFPYSEISSYTRLLLNLGKEAKAIVVNQEGEKVSLGPVMLKQLAIDKDGEAKLTVVGDLLNIDLASVGSMLEQQVSYYTLVDDGAEADGE